MCRTCALADCKRECDKGVIDLLVKRGSTAYAMKTCPDCVFVFVSDAAA